MLQLDWLIEVLTSEVNGELLQRGEEEEWFGLHFDSRQIQPGNIFLALTGGARDGHTFIPDAIRQGSRIIILSNPTYAESIPATCSIIRVPDTELALQRLAARYRKLLPTRFITITGSNGKTTTKDMMAHLLRAHYPTYATYKNLNNHLGVPLSLLHVKPEHQFAVLEIGMNHPGEIDFLAQLIQPDHSVITNVNDAHLEFFGTKEGIAAAKAELIPHTNPAGSLILNGDDPLVRAMQDNYPGKVYLYGLTADELQIKATQLQSDEQGTHFQVELGADTFPCHIPLYGRHNVANLLPGILLAYQSGISSSAIQEQARSLRISDMRFQRLQGWNGVTIINDAYNASPTSMRAAIDTFLSILPEKAKVLVLGDMFELGAESAQLHAQLGDDLNRYQQQLTQLFTIGDQMAHCFQAYKGMKRHTASPEELIEELQPYLQAENALLFKGSRGMRLEQVIQHLLP